MIVGFDWEKFGVIDRCSVMGGGHFPEVVAHEGIICLVAFNFVIHLKSAIEFGLSDYNFDDLFMSLQGSILKKSSGRLLVTH